MDCKSGIIGLAIGDSLWVPVEFLDRKQLEKEPVTDFNVELLPIYKLNK